MKINLTLQVNTVNKHLPSQKECLSWIKKTLEKIAGEKKESSLTLRIVNRQEGQALNYQYKNKDKATNVLSFPPTKMPGKDPDYLGDIVMCAPVIEQEAIAQNKPLKAHWAHLMIHGVLHLLGLDHKNDQEAEIMEALETTLLLSLGFENPYE